MYRSISSGSRRPVSCLPTLTLRWWTPGVVYELETTRAALHGLRVGGVILEVQPAGLDALARVHVARAPLSSLVRVSNELEPSSLVRIDRRHAAELAWEVAPAERRSVLRAIEKLLPPPPHASVTWQDPPWGRTRPLPALGPHGMNGFDRL